jgi:uncharacterized protein with HEPN domain
VPSDYAAATGSAALAAGPSVVSSAVYGDRAKAIRFRHPGIDGIGHQGVRRDEPSPPSETVERVPFAAHATRPDACKRHVQHLGEAASHQSPARSARLPGINWQRLDAFRPVSVVASMSAVEVWSFIRDEVPALAEALQ